MDLSPVLNFGELRAGDVVPAGVCKHCGRLSYLATDEELKAHAERRKPGSFNVQFTVHVTEEALALVPKDVAAPQILTSQNLVQRFVSHATHTRSKEPNPLDACWLKLSITPAQVTEIHSVKSVEEIEKIETEHKQKKQPPPAYTISTDDEELDLRDCMKLDPVQECLETTKHILAGQDDGVPGWWSSVTSLTNTMIRQWNYRINRKPMAKLDVTTPEHFEPGDVMYLPTACFGSQSDNKFAIVTGVSKRKLLYSFMHRGQAHLGSTNVGASATFVRNNVVVIGQRVFDGELRPNSLAMIDPRKVAKHWDRLNKNYPPCRVVFDLMGQLLTVGIRSMLSSYVSVCPIGKDPSKVANFVSIPSEYLIEVINKQGPSPIAKKKKQEKMKLTKVAIAKIEPRAKPQVIKKAKPEFKQTSPLAAFSTKHLYRDNLTDSHFEVRGINHVGNTITVAAGVTYNAKRNKMYIRPRTFTRRAAMKLVQTSYVITTEKTDRVMLDPIKIEQRWETVTAGKSKATTAGLRAIIRELSGRVLCISHVPGSVLPGHIDVWQRGSLVIHEIPAAFVMYLTTKT